MSDLLSVGLPKWPGMLVVGEPVTIEQAEDILIRTSGLNTFTNSNYVRNALLDTFGIERTDDFTGYDWESLQRQRQHFKVLELEYLTNDRIVSIWIGGPHGWCNWDGRIGSCNYNIGKWPHVDGILEEWQTIAVAFPFLRLRCQLLDREICEALEANESYRPLVEYIVSEGNATVREPVGLIATPVDLDNLAPWWLEQQGAPAEETELGISLAQLRRVVQRFKKRHGLP